mmetsp:Transcript_4898/g.15834  ORF Transcript_4898/g.15834 Transcript_4898/m.15834 type:complete len:106 (-) Transcript_4898:349-666(-)
MRDGTEDGGRLFLSSLTSAPTSPLGDRRRRQLFVPLLTLRLHAALSLTLTLIVANAATSAPLASLALGVVVSFLLLSILARVSSSWSPSAAGPRNWRLVLPARCR